MRQVLRVCLQKDPKQRAQAIGDVRLALEGAFETVAPQAIATATASRGRSVWIAALAVAMAVIVVLAIPAMRYLRETLPPPLLETRVEITTPATDRPSDFALSPDGRQIVFVASGDGPSRLWLRSLASTTAQPLTGTEGARLPFWSPDGRAIGFFAGNALKRLDLGGGSPQPLASADTFVVTGGTWNTDGVIVFAPSSIGPLRRVSASGGAVTAVTTLSAQQAGHVAPFFLPDGRRFLFYVNGVPDTTGIYLGALDGGEPTRLTPAASAGVYLPAGWLLWVRAGTQTLVAQRLDLAQAALTGEPVTVADGFVPGQLVRAISVAATGLVAYRTDAGGLRQLIWVDRAGTRRGPLGDPDATLECPRVSPDGRRVAVSRTLQGNVDLWLLDGTRASRFTFDAAVDRWPVWSPDGSRIVFSSTRTVSDDLYQKLTSGAAVEERIVASDQLKAATSWSVDGRFVLYRTPSGDADGRVLRDPTTSVQTYGDLWVVPMVASHTPSVFLKMPFQVTQGTFSPDGRWVAYQSNESGRNEVYVRPFVPPGAEPRATAGGQWQVSTAGGIMPAWRPDGKELYYLNPAGAMMAAPITVTGAGLEPGAPIVLFPTHIVGGGAVTGVCRQYDVAPDGRFLINTVLDGATVPITLLMNWNPEVKK